MLLEYYCIAFNSDLSISNATVQNVYEDIFPVINLRKKKSTPPVFPLNRDSNPRLVATRRITRRPPTNYARRADISRRNEITIFENNVSPG